MKVYFTLLPPANEVCEGCVFTSVCLSTGWGVSAPVHAWIHPWDKRQTPADQRQTPTSPWDDRQTHPPGGDTLPPAQCILGDTGNKRAVHILLECILVVLYVPLIFCVKNMIPTFFFKKTDHEVVWNFWSRVQRHYIIPLVYIANF